MLSIPITCLQTFVNIPKPHWNFWKKCGKHLPHNTTQSKKGKDSLYARGKWHYARKQIGYGRQNRGFSRKSLKPQRRLCWGLNVLRPTLEIRECWLLRDASILSREEIRERTEWSSSKLHLLSYYEDNKIFSSLLYIFFILYIF